MAKPYKKLTDSLYVPDGELSYHLVFQPKQIDPVISPNEKVRYTECVLPRGIYNIEDSENGQVWLGQPGASLDKVCVRRGQRKLPDLLFFAHQKGSGGKFS